MKKRGEKRYYIIIFIYYKLVHIEILIFKIARSFK